jgi:Excalibur calcium-binding domain
MLRGMLLAGVVGLGVLLAPVAQAAGPYKNCTQAKDDGACNIPSSSEYYQAKLDRDGDGIGCEC